MKITEAHTEAMRQLEFQVRFAIGHQPSTSPGQPGFRTVDVQEVIEALGRIIGELLAMSTDDEFDRYVQWLRETRAAWMKQPHVLAQREITSGQQ